MDLINALYDTSIQNPATTLSAIPMSIPLPEVLVLLQYRIKITGVRDFNGSYVIRQDVRPFPVRRYSRYLRNINSWTQDNSMPSVQMARIIIALIASGLTVVILFPIDSYAWSDYFNDLEALWAVHNRLHMTSGMFLTTVQGASHLPNIIAVGPYHLPIGNMHDYADAYSQIRYTPLDLLRQVDPRGFPFIGIKDTIDPALIARYFPDFAGITDNQSVGDTELNNPIGDDTAGTSSFSSNWLIVSAISVSIVTLSVSIISSLDITTASDLILTVI